MTLQLLEEVGEGFGGRVFQSSIEKVEDIFVENKEAFTKSGMNSFLKALRVPSSFFQKQPQNLQIDLIVSQKHLLREKSPEMLFLVNGDETQIEFVAPKTDIGWHDPAIKLGVDPTNWDISRLDYTSGVQRYIQRSDKLVKDEYIPSLMLEIPIFYYGYLTMQAGLFKVICSNGMLDTVRSSQIKFNMKKTSVDMIAAILVNSASAMATVGNPYKLFLNHLQETSITIGGARAMLFELEDAKIPKTLLKWTERHLDQVESGRKVPDGSPKVIDAEYKVLDTLTFHAQRLPSMGVQATAEKRIFNFFYDRYTGDDSLSLDDRRARVIEGVAVKSFQPEIQTQIVPTETE